MDDRLGQRGVSNAAYPPQLLGCNKNLVKLRTPPGFYMICEARAPVFEPTFKNSRMQPSGGPQQQHYDYEYSAQYSQQQQQQPERPAIPSMRPTLEAPAYYHPSPLPQQFTPQQTYYQPSRTPVAISQFPYAESPPEHKPIAAYQQQQQHSDYRIQAAHETRSEPVMPMERMCDVCQYPDPVLVAPNCNHTFHSRCVHVWPLDACPACAAPMDQVAILPSVNMMVRPEPAAANGRGPRRNLSTGSCASSTARPCPWLTARRSAWCSLRCSTARP